MIETLKREWFAKIALVIFLFFTGWWIYIQFPPGNSSSLVQYFGVFYGLMAIWGGICGVIISKKWGGFQSIIGRALLMFSIGLFAQEFGQIAYSYYIYVLHVEIPYPSIGDVGYFGSIPFYIYGTYLLSQASGVHFGLKLLKNKIQAVIIPLIMLGISYALFLQDYAFDFSTPLVVFLDFGYPMGQAIYVSLAILTYLLSRKILGGIMKTKILFILIALVLQYLSDYVFLYQVSSGTWTVGGFNEWMYLVAYFIMTIAIIQFYTVLKKIKS